MEHVRFFIAYKASAFFICFVGAGLNAGYGNFVGHTACRGRGITGRRAVAVYAVIGRVAYAYVGMGIITAPGIAGAKRY